MNRRVIVSRLPRTASVLLLGSLLAGCEPASITEARNQLARGPARITRYSIPVIDTTLTLSDFLPDSSKDTVTTPEGLLGIRFDAESIAVDVGPRLRFNGVGFTPFNASFSAGTLALPAGTRIGFSTTYSALSNEPRLLAIDTVVVETGTLTITTSNKLPITQSYTLTLNGMRDAGGTVITRSGNIPAAPGDGTYTSSTLVIDLAGVTVVPAVVQATLTDSATLAGTIAGALGTNAVTQSATGTMFVRRLAGPLNPATTPELAVAIENSEEILRADLDFGELEDVVEAATVNNAQALLTVRNASGTPIVLSNFRLGAVKLGAFGQLNRDAQGNPDYEKDAANNPILLTVADPGQATLSVARNASTTVALNAAPLVDRLIHVVLANQRVALVGKGTATAGDGSQSRISRTDDIQLAFQLVVGIDLTLPVAGVQFDLNDVNDGGDLGMRDADEIVTRLVAASVGARVVDSTPFGAVVDLAVLADSQPGVDVFAHPNRVIITNPADPITLNPPAVDATGRVTTASRDSVAVTLSGAQVRPLLGRKFTSAARIRLTPGVGAGGRSALRATDQITVRAAATIDIRSGGAQ